MSETLTAQVPLSCQRDAFELPDDICWLNSAYMSPLLHSVRKAAAGGVTARAKPWSIRSEDFFTPAETVRQLFADLIHATVDEIAIVPSVSYAVGIATRNLSAQAGQNIVTVVEQFPSNIYPWRKLATERRATVRTVQLPPVDRTAAIVDAIDADTAAVAIPHVHWTTGTQFDVIRIAQKARSVGAALIVDTTQSLGTLPFDVSVIQPDFMMAAAYKGLLGPYGMTYLYVNPRWHNAVPLEEGWLNRANAADFSQLTEYCDDYMPGARRFDFGECASTILLPMAIASLQQLKEWTLPRIEATTRPLIDYILDGADAAGLTHPPRDECSPCMVGIGLPGDAPNDLGRQLAERGVHVSIRKANARVATHVYNTREDVDRFFNELATFLKAH